MFFENWDWGSAAGGGRAANFASEKQLQKVTKATKAEVPLPWEFYVFPPSFPSVQNVLTSSVLASKRA